MVGSQSDGEIAKITIIGSINCDIAYYVDSFPRVNQTIHAKDSILSPGGKGLNQAVAAARVGAEVNFIGCVGNDSFGTMALKYLSANKVETANIRIIDGAATGMANIIATENGNNMITVSPGANFHLMPQNIEHIENATDIIKNADIVLVQLEIPVETVRTVLSITKKHNIKTILDPSPAVDSANDLVKLADIVTPNEIEISELTGIDVSQPNRRLNLRKIKESIEILRCDSNQAIIATLGRDGAFLMSDTISRHIPCFPVDAIDTTGAGDVFNGTLAVAMAEQKTIDEAVIWASAAATLSVTKPTAANSAPYRKEIESFIREKTAIPEII